MDIERLKELADCDVFIGGNPIVVDRAQETLRTLIDEAIARQSVKSDIGETSDGYHTFNELYEHRTALFATLCNMRYDISWKSMKHDDGTMYDGMFIAGIETPDGQYTYHCDMKYLYMFAYTPEVDKAPPYDGHQPKDYPRLLRLSKSSLYRQNRQSVKSEEVAEAISWLTSTGHSNQYMSGNWTAPMKHHINRVIQETILTALQAYEPWVSVEDRLPESGKHVLLCCEVRPSGKRYVCDGYYAGSKSITCGCSDDLDCEYDEETDEHYLPEGYYEVIKNWDDYSSIVIYDFVTHWKPLPEPPKGE